MLLIDAGNSRLKWGVVAAGKIIDKGVSVYCDTGLPQACKVAWERHFPKRVVVANVAGPLFAKRLSDWCRQRLHLQPEFIEPQRCAYGVDTRYHDPSRLGVDRWVALIAVRASAPVCVVDCGTAVTLDLLSPHGVHLGGMILPGLSVMRDSLYQRAPGIVRHPIEAEQEQAVIYGRDTGSCIEQGTLHAVAGAIERITVVWDEQVTALKKIITGGDAHIMQPLLKEGYHMQPDFVLHGLQIIANRRQ